MVGLLLTLVGCAEPAAEVSPQEAVRRLVRVSLDLRGVRPTEAEIEQVEADPAAIEGLTAEFVTDERFFAHLVQLYQEIYLSETEGLDLRPSNVPYDDAKPYYWLVGQEPLQIVGQVAREDLPYTEVVTGDWTMAEEHLGETFPVEWPEGQTGWHKTRYTDGRPAAGVMATNGLWWRYTTTEANANRRRANALTRILVCEDFLARPIEFDQGINLLDVDAVADALENNPGCVNCHVSLDPVAANLFGFYWTNFSSPTEGRYYYAGRERTWMTLTGVAPGWFGASTNGLVDLGAAVAADPRFPTCAARQAFERMMRRDATNDDTDDITALREAFLDDGMRLKALYRAVTELPVYRVGDVDTERGAPLKMMAPDVLGTAIAALTGFVWTRDGAEVMLTDDRGLRSLAGGVEGIMVKRPAPAPGAGVALVQEALASEAASYALNAEQALEPAERILFTEIDFTETPDAGRAAMVAQLQALHLRLFGARVAADGQEVEGDLGLWSELYEVEGDVPLAWQGVLVALLRDPDFLLY